MYTLHRNILLTDEKASSYSISILVRYVCSNEEAPTAASRPALPCPPD